MVTTMVFGPEQLAQARQHVAHPVRLERQQHRVLRAGVGHVLHRLAVGACCSLPSSG